MEILYGFLLVVIPLVILALAAWGMFSLARFFIKRTKGSKNSKSTGDSLTQSKRTSVTTENKESGNEESMDTLESLKNSPTARFMLIGLIALLMTIPLASITSVVDERHSLHNQVLKDIAAQWGEPQVVQGPMLVVPFQEKRYEESKQTQTDGSEKTIQKLNLVNRHLVLLPSQLKQDIRLKEHYRNRSIYKSLVYQADIAIKGHFDFPKLSQLTNYETILKPEKAFLVMGLSDNKAIESISELTFNDKKYDFDPGTRLIFKGRGSTKHVSVRPIEYKARMRINDSQNNVISGFHVLAPVTPKGENKGRYNFSFNLKARGSSGIRFSAFGKETKVNIESEWQHPSFQGDVLPTKRKLDDSGFQAQWEIPSLARNYPQSWIYEDKKDYDLGSLLAGVDLYEPVFLYSMINRAIKYGILFIGLTFLTFIIFEMTQGFRLHGAQYVLIGLSLAMFFLTLLALSEHMPFLNAYIISSFITILSISIYAWFSTRNTKQAAMIFILLVALYAVLYSLLQLEDYALLMGTGLLLFVLFVLMWITRNMKLISNDNNT